MGTIDALNNNSQIEDILKLLTQLDKVPAELATIQIQPNTALYQAALDEIKRLKVDNATYKGVAENLRRRLNEATQPTRDTLP